MTLAEPFRSRVATLHVGLAERGLEGVIVRWAPHVCYFSGVVSAWSPAYLLVDGQGVLGLVPESAGIGAAAGIELHTYFDGTMAEIVSSRRNALVEIARNVQDR